VLGVARPHLGTDYAAPVGTPVQAVADGRVIFSGLSGGSGNLITLQHANGYVTQYLHLSRRLVQRGERVKQGQRIGLVGMTGLATGPHLDIRVQKNGRYVNWETLKVPRETRIATASMPAFEKVRDGFAALMTDGADSGTKLAAGEPAPEIAR
jgi:murein DD-endopeptidase MepM/ murein hydrolase activator NlpD